MPSALTIALKRPPMHNIEKIKAFARTNFMSDDQLKQLHEKFGGEVQHTGGGCMVWALQYDDNHTVVVSDEVLCIYKCKIDEWMAHDGSDPSVFQETIWFRNEEREQAPGINTLQKIKVLTDAKDQLERSLPKFRAADYDCTELEDYIKHLTADIVALQVPA
jgi:hypothetical protein